MNTISNLPPMADLVRLVRSLMPAKGYWLTKYDEPISDDVWLSEDDCRDALASGDYKANDFTPVSIQLTVGWSPETGAWSYQTGDNSYTGGAYGHPVWAVVWITHESDPAEIAEELLNELAESVG